MFKIKKIAVRIAFWYILLVLFLFGAVLSLIVYNYSNSILKEKQNVSNQKLDIIASELKDSISWFHDIQASLIADSEITNILIKNYNQTDLSSSSTQLINDKLYNLRSEHRFIDSIYLLDINGDIIGSASDSITASRVQEFPWFHKFVEAKSYGSFPAFENSADAVTVNYYGAYYLQPQYNYVAYIALRVNKNRMFYNFEHLSSDFFDNIIVFNEDQNIYNSNPEFAISKLADFEGLTNINLYDTDYMVFANEVYANPTWKIFALANQKTFSQEVSTLTLFIFFFFAAIIIIIAISSFVIAKSITKPLLNVNKAMGDVEKGIFPPPISSHTADETNELILKFNRMVENLKLLQENISKEQTERREIEVAMVKSQLELLQSQINPHFIHNTLNTLNYMAITGGNQELSETISSFNSLLRASISSSTDFITLQEEMGYIKDYMNIQYRRYSFDQILYEPTIAADVKDALVPRLIMQPLVENALFHGLLPLTSCIGYIKILCFKQNNFLHVYIVDNGIGIPPDKLNQIVSGELPNARGYNHIGIRNVKERLMLIYHDQYQFHISSIENGGTTIYFSIPYVDEEMET
jgi:Predicted signal transduction protein with a C-terminal ATPase domain